MILAVDFDNVIHDPKNKEAGYKMGKPLTGAQFALRLLRDRDITIIIHTLWAREPAGRQAVESWLKYFECPFDEVTAVKPKADMYLDDKGWRFESWEAMMPVFDQMIRAGI